MSALEPVLLAIALLLLPVRSARVALLHRRDEASVAGQPNSVTRLLSRWPERARAPVAAAASGALGAAVAGVIPGAVLAVAVFWLVLRARRRAGPPETDPLALAAGWDLLAAGMRAGLPLVVLVRAVAAELADPAATALREVAGLLELGADPASAWEPALRHPGTAEIARAARRSARTGSALAEVADGLASEARTAVADRAQAAAQRAGVWITAPLGLCFLPAFLCLGVVPVVAGMVQRLAATW